MGDATTKHCVSQAYLKYATLPKFDKNNFVENITDPKRFAAHAPTKRFSINATSDHQSSMQLVMERFVDNKIYQSSVLIPERSEKLQKQICP